jgi:hypothetical protein
MRSIFLIATAVMVSAPAWVRIASAQAPQPATVAALAPHSRYAAAAGFASVLRARSRRIRRASASSTRNS